MLDERRILDPARAEILKRSVTTEQLAAADAYADAVIADIRRRGKPVKNRPGIWLNALRYGYTVPATPERATSPLPEAGKIDQERLAAQRADIAQREAAAAAWWERMQPDQRERLLDRLAAGMTRWEARIQREWKGGGPPPAVTVHLMGELQRLGGVPPAETGDGAGDGANSVTSEKGNGDA
jgi:hypothetical protein